MNNQHQAALEQAAAFQQWVINEFRANGGVVGGPFEGSALLLLTTMGARTGRERTVPLGFVDVGERQFVVGSAGGSDRHPAWFHNVRATPGVRVEIGGRSYAATATVVEGPERPNLWAAVTRREPGYAEYQAGTARRLPLVELRAAGPEKDWSRGRAAS